MMPTTSSSVAHVLNVCPTGHRGRGTKYEAKSNDLERCKAGSRPNSPQPSLLDAAMMLPAASSAPKCAAPLAIRPSDPEAAIPLARAPRNPRKPAPQPMPHHPAPPPNHLLQCPRPRLPPPCAPPPPPEHTRLPHARGRAWPPHHRLPHLPNHRLRTRRRLPRRPCRQACLPCLLASWPSSPPSPPAWRRSMLTCTCSCARMGPCFLAPRLRTPLPAGRPLTRHRHARLPPCLPCQAAALGCRR